MIFTTQISKPKCTRSPLLQPPHLHPPPQHTHIPCQHCGYWNFWRGNYLTISVFWEEPLETALTHTGTQSFDPATGASKSKKSTDGRGKLVLKGNYTPTALALAPSTQPARYTESKEVRGASSAHEMAPVQRAVRNDRPASLCDTRGLPPQVGCCRFTLSFFTVVETPCEVTHAAFIGWRPEMQSVSITSQLYFVLSSCSKGVADLVSLLARGAETDVITRHDSECFHLKANWRHRRLRTVSITPAEDQQSPYW